MATTSTIAHPIETLREHVTALEAAITLCLADPDPKPVHKLRTSTRRIEAQLTLLSLLPRLPQHDKPAKKARKILKQFRSAAGDVRDLDVQLDLIQEKSTDTTKQESRQLRKSLKRKRADAEDDLLKLVHKDQAKLATTLESLLDALKPAQSLALTPAQLTRMTQRWFTQSLPNGSSNRHEDPDQLHAIRKTAKLARYIAETAPESARTPRKLAEDFESLQQSGGEWHDWLILSDIAHNKLGKSSRLAQTFQRQCTASLNAYRHHLQTMPGPPAPPPS